MSSLVLPQHSGDDLVLKTLEISEFCGHSNPGFSRLSSSPLFGATHFSDILHSMTQGLENLCVVDECYVSG